MVLLLIKLLVAVVGLVLIIRHLILGVTQGSNQRLKQSVKILFFVLSFFAISTTIEFALKNIRNRGLVMYAMREAPIGGIWLKLFNNQKFQLGYLPNDKELEGTYEIIGDTLFLKGNKPNGLLNDSDSCSFIFKRGMLVEIDKRNLGPLEITMNELKKN